jgi:hypothetical protein
MNRLVLLGGLAFAGSVAGHGVAYIVSHLPAHERSAALIRSGHGAFREVAVGAAVAGVVALLGLALRVRRYESVRFTWLARRLIPLQLAMFIALELTERGFEPSRTFGDPAVLAGLIAQVFVALGAALLARGVECVARAITRAVLPSTVRAPARQALPPPPGFLPSSPWRRGEAQRRAPPIPLAA